MTRLPDENDRYLPALDGLRAISISLVLLSHAGLQNIVPGGLGVLVFFVISGFLLTRQMVMEIDRSGTLNIKNFYLRRFLRLAPALLAYIALFTCVVIWQGSNIRLPQLLSGLFYFANYYSIYIGYPAYSPFPILWSLAVEEHYYILFPFFLLLFRRRPARALPWLCLMVIAVCIWRIVIYHACTGAPASLLCGLPDHERIFHGTDTIFDCILYGAITALALHYHPALFRRFFLTVPVFVLAGLLLAATLLYREPAFRDTLRFSLQAISIALIMVNSLFGDWRLNGLKKLLSQPLCLWIGRLSYSLYLFHYGMLNAVQALHHDALNVHDHSGLAIYAIGTFALASASYYLIEKPMSVWRRRLHNQSLHS